MNFLILHTVRFDLIGYDRAIDHEQHQVVYIGAAEKLDQIPAHLPCTRLVRPCQGSLYDEVSQLVASLDQSFDFLISVTESDIVDAARLRARFGIPGPTPAQAEKVRNKTVMKHCVLEHGIRAPRFSTFENWLSNGLQKVDIATPVILKPFDGASSVNVKKFANQEALRTAWAERKTGIHLLDTGDNPPLHNFEVEEFVAGPVLHIDGIANAGKLQIALASRYVNTLLEYANGKPAGSIQMRDWPDMYDWVAKVLQAVEIGSGAFHLEVIDGPDGIVFLEIAHRVGGARITETFERKTGIHLAVADIKAISDPTFQVKPVWDHDYYYGWFVVPAHHLQQPYCRVSGHEYLKGDPTMLAMDELGSDTAVPARITYAENLLPLAGMVRAPAPEQLQQILTDLFANIRVDPV